MKKKRSKTEGRLPASVFRSRWPPQAEAARQAKSHGNGVDAGSHAHPAAHQLRATGLRKSLDIQGGKHAHGIRQKHAADACAQQPPCHREMSGGFPPAIIKTPAPSRIHNSGSYHADRENCIGSGAPTTNTFHAASKASRETPVFTHIPVFVPDFIQKRATARTAGRTAHQNQAVPASTNIHGTGTP